NVTPARLACRFAFYFPFHSFLSNQALSVVKHNKFTLLCLFSSLSASLHSFARHCQLLAFRLYPILKPRLCSHPVAFSTAPSYSDKLPTLFCIFRLFLDTKSTSRSCINPQ